MKLKHNLLTVLFVGILAMATLPSCSVLQPQPVAELKLPGNLSEAGKEAQKLINEANVALTAAYRVLVANVNDGTITPMDGSKYLDLLNDYSVQVDKAQDFLNVGNIADAKTKAEAVNKLVVALHKKVSDKAKGN